MVQTDITGSPAWFWGWSDGAYVWHGGYWARHVGFYGGINYGYGYAGTGYEGGHWNNRVFYYNTAVTRVNVSVVNNTYEKPVLAKTTAESVVSYHGGAGGMTVTPTKQELIAADDPHIGPTSHQKKIHKAAAPKPMPKKIAKKSPPEKKDTSEKKEKPDNRDREGNISNMEKTK
jgi:hypothetical protein